MVKIKPRQLLWATFVGLLLIWLVRVGDNSSNQTASAKTVEMITLPSDDQKGNWQDDKVEKRLLALLPKKKVDDASSKAPEEAVKEAKPKPEPPPIDRTVKPDFALLDDDHQVGLIAIVQENDNKFAIIQRINFETRESKNIKVRDKGVFGNMDIEIRSQTQVILKSPQREIFLNLFKPRNK